MRARHQTKVCLGVFVLCVFASGVLCGYYYESTVSIINIDNIDTRLVPAEFAGDNIVDDDVHNNNKGHLHVPSNLKDHPDSEPDSKEDNVAIRETVIIGNATGKDSTADTDVKHHDSAKEKLNEKITNDVKLRDTFEIRQSDDLELESFHSHISRKEFGSPMRLQPQPQPNRKNDDSPHLHERTYNDRVQPLHNGGIHRDVKPPAINDQRLQELEKEALRHHQQQQQQQHRLKQGPVPTVKPVGVPPQPPAPKDTAENKLKHAALPAAQGTIVGSVVICGDRTDEALTMIKSAVVLTAAPLHFHVFAEEELQNDIATKIEAWPRPYSTRLTFTIHDIAFPSGENPEEWKKMFKKCATQRLFLPDLLTDTDSLLYVDTDILFIRPLEYIWSFFEKFNSTQLAALTPEHEITNIGWYNRFARHPYYGMTGLNSGVMLMNLTRMRNIGWSSKILPIYRKYKTHITWGDQDLLNILFHFHPEMVYVYPCEWNVRPDHCMYSLNCHRIGDHGVSIIHGNRGVYHNDKQLPFRIIYEAFRDYKFGTNFNLGLVQPLKQRFTEQDVANMYCTKALALPLIATLNESYESIKK